MNLVVNSSAQAQLTSLFTTASYLWSEDAALSLGNVGKSELSLGHTSASDSQTNNHYLSLINYAAVLFVYVLTTLLSTLGNLIVLIIFICRPARFEQAKRPTSSTNQSVFSGSFYRPTQQPIHPENGHFGSRKLALETNLACPQYARGSSRMRSGCLPAEDGSSFADASRSIDLMKAADREVDSIEAANVDTREYHEVKEEEVDGTLSDVGAQLTTATSSSRRKQLKIQKSMLQPKARKSRSTDARVDGSYDFTRLSSRLRLPHSFTGPRKTRLKAQRLGPRLSDTGQNCISNTSLCQTSEEAAPMHIEAKNRPFLAFVASERKPNTSELSDSLPIRLSPASRGSNLALALRDASDAKTSVPANAIEASSQTAASTVAVTLGPVHFSPFQCYLASLAVSDLMIGVFCIPFTFPIIFLRSWPFPHVFCPLVTYLQLFAVTASILTNMAIGLDRLICVQFPIQRHRLTPRAAFRRTLCILAAIWTAAGLGSSIQLYVTRVVTQPDGVVNCSEDWGKDSDRQRVYSIVLFMLIYLIPLSILGITYGIVGRKLWQRRLPGAQVHEQEIMQLKSKRKASGKIL